MEAFLHDFHLRIADSPQLRSGKNDLYLATYLAIWHFYLATEDIYLAIYLATGYVYLAPTAPTTYRSRHRSGEAGGTA